MNWEFIRLNPEFYSDCISYNIMSLFLKVEHVSEPPGRPGKMQIVGCHSRSFSIVVSAKKTKQDELMVSMLVRVLDAIKQD